MVLNYGRIVFEEILKVWTEPLKCWNWRSRCPVRENVRYLSHKLFNGFELKEALLPHLAIIYRTNDIDGILTNERQDVNRVIGISCYCLLVYHDYKTTFIRVVVVFLLFVYFYFLSAPEIRM